MPNVIIEMHPGRSLEEHRLLVRKVTDAVVDSLGVDPAGVRVRIAEIDRHHFAVGGILRSDVAH